MPWINDRFYANLLFGRALERARVADEGGVWSERLPAAREATEFDEASPSYTQVSNGQRQRTPAQHAKGLSKHRHGDNYNAATTQQGIANQVYNETSGLRPTTLRGPGSDFDFQQARKGIAATIHNRAAERIGGGLSSPTISTREERSIHEMASAAYDAHGESVFAAHLASLLPKGAFRADHFYLDYGQPAPKWAKEEDHVASFGPFLNTNAAGKIPSGRRVIIRFYNLKTDKNDQ